MRLLYLYSEQSVWLLMGVHGGGGGDGATVPLQ